MNRLQLVKRTAIVAVIGAFFVCSVFFAPFVLTQENEVPAAGQEGVQLFNFLGEKKLLEDSNVKKLSIAALNQQDILINLQVLMPSNGFADSESMKRLQIPLFDGKTYEAVQSESKGFVQYKPGEFTWRGKIKSGEFSGDVVLTANNGAMSGLIYSPTAVYEIVPQENFTHVLVELDQSLFPDCGGGIIPPKEPKAKSRFSILERAESQQTAQENFNIKKLPDFNRSLEFDSPMADDGSQIDVMVVYSDDVRAALGGTAQAQALAQNSIAVTNTAYQNSGINTSVRLVHAREITYDESPGTLDAALNWIDSNSTIAADRNTYRADMVAFIIQNASDGCGLAYVMNNVGAGFAPLAFSAVTQGCAVGNLSFPHELGHNQGMHHNPENAPGSGTAYPYNYGHWVNNSFRTVMSYANPCTGFNCPRVPYFSNPSVNYNGQPTGITNQRDNRRVLNNTAATVANFRESCSYSISPTFQILGSAGGTVNVNVTAPSGCQWTADESLDWASIAAGASGSGNGTVFLSVDPNTSTNPRNGLVTIAGQDFSLGQQGASCTYSLSPTFNIFTPSGGEIDVTVTAPAGCAWTAAESLDWVSITSGASGSGSGTVKISTPVNNSGAFRSGVVVIAGIDFSVGQQACSYTLSANSANPTAAGGIGSVNVTAATGCAWSATSNNSWINVTGGTPGSGNGSVNYSVEPNLGTARTGTITIAGQTFTVNQAASAIIYYEADVAPRPNGNGNGVVNSGDVTQIQRFAVGLDQPFQLNEFQRADSAPRLAQDGTTLLLGNGTINTGDVTQAYRYSVGLDGGAPLAGGPTGPGGAKSASSDAGQSGKLEWLTRGIGNTNDWLFNPNILRNTTDSSAALQATYEVRAIRESLTATTLTVAIRLDTDASAATLAASVGGTLRFDTTKLSNPTNIRLGSGVPGGTSFFANDSDTANGRLGFTINAPVDETFPIGEQKLLLIDFTVTGTGATVLSFDSSQAQRFVGNINGNELTPSEFPPTEIALSPTSAMVTVSGRVIFSEGRAGLLNSRSRAISRARVWYTNAQGQTRNVETNERGYFRFDLVEAGYTYTFEAEAKGRRFAPQVVTVMESVDNLTFTR